MDQSVASKVRACWSPEAAATSAVTPLPMPPTVTVTGPVGCVVRVTSYAARPASATARADALRATPRGSSSVTVRVRVPVTAP